MNYRWLVRVKENHSFGNLFCNAYSSSPWKRNLWLMKNIEKCSSMAILAYNIIVCVMLSYSNHSYQLWMMSNLYWGHNFSFKLFLRSRRIHIIFNFLYSNLPASPFSFKNFGWMTKPYFLFKFKLRIFNEILFCTFFHLLDDETF